MTQWLRRQFAAASGGFVGCLTAEAYGEDVDPLAKAVSSLAHGATSDIVETKGGYHLVRFEGRLAATGKLRAVIEPRRNEAGVPTVIVNSRFSSIEGTPAWIGRAPELAVSLPEHGFQFVYEGRSAIEGAFRFEG